jgi:hypothetical protein
VEKDSAQSSAGFGTLGDLLNKKLKSK